MNLTQWIIVSSVGVILAIDGWLAVTRGKDATISVQLTKWGKQYPFIPFAMGFLMGHFWAQNT
jgi:hypothetical protein